MTSNRNSWEIPIDNLSFWYFVKYNNYLYETCVSSCVILMISVRGPELNFPGMIDRSKNNRRITETQSTWQECVWRSVARWASVQFLFSGGSNYDWTPMAAARWLVGGLKGICGTDTLQRGLMCPSQSLRVNEHCLEPVFPWTLYIFYPTENTVTLSPLKKILSLSSFIFIIRLMMMSHNIDSPNPIAVATFSKRKWLLL